MTKTSTTVIKAMLAIAVMIATGTIETWAQHAGHGGVPSSPQPAPSVWFGKVKGKVVELGQNTITIEKLKKREAERFVVLMDGRTEVKGDLQVGADVVIKYREGLGSRTATRIEVQKPKEKKP